MVLWPIGKSFHSIKFFGFSTCFFLSLVPLGQFALRQFPWGRILNNQTIIYANGIILLCDMVYVVVRQRASKEQHETQKEKHHWPFKKTPLFILYFTACALLIAFSNKGHFWAKRQWCFDRKRNATTIGR